MAHFRGQLVHAQRPLAVVLGVVLHHVALVLQSALLIHQLECLVNLRVLDDHVEVYPLLQFLLET